MSIRWLAAISSWLPSRSDAARALLASAWPSAVARSACAAASALTLAARPLTRLHRLSYDSCQFLACTASHTLERVMTQITKAHGSRNDIFIVPLTPADFPTEAELREFVRALCDRSGPLGGDGVYFYSDAALAWFFNPDGSSAEFCGNGMRCLGRVVLDLRGADRAVIQSGDTSYTVSRGPVTPEGVQQISLEHPRVDFGELEARLDVLDPALTFSAVSVPNPHLITFADKYVESDLVAMGETIAGRRDVFPAGANLSVLLPVSPDLPAGGEVFVRTYERGAGLTASCGSGMVAARAVYSRLGRAAQDVPVIIHNSGGVAEVALRDWRPILQGNATYVYRAEVSLSAVPSAIERFDDEERAYAALERQNQDWLRSNGIS
jgi:diaminopimelate epimerase